MSNGRENLIPFNESKLSEEELREIYRKGGINSAKVRKRKKTMRETIKMLLEMDVMDDEVKAKIQAMGQDPEAVDYATAIGLAMIKKATEGNISAFNTIRDTIGEKPEDTVNINNELSPEDKKKATEKFIRKLEKETGVSK